MDVVAATSWADSVRNSVSQSLAVLLDGIPKIIGFLIILIVGWIIAAIVARVVADVLRAVKFNDLANRSGITGFVKDMGMDTDASGVLAGIVKWFIRLVFLVAAFDALGLPAISAVMQKFLLWLPNLVVALVVLVIAGLLAGAASRVVRGATTEAGIGNPGLFATLTSWAIWAFGIIVAVNQIGIASTLVNTLFTAFVGAIALAFALAFGLGGRETASQIVQNWYQKSQQAQASGQLQQAAQAAGNQTQAMKQQAKSTVQQSTGGGSRPTDGTMEREQRPTTR